MDLCLSCPGVQQDERERKGGWVVWTTDGCQPRLDAKSQTQRRLNNMVDTEDCRRLVRRG